MDKLEVMEAENRFTAAVYAKRPIVISQGRGASLWDIDGKEYIDCTGSYGQCVVGYGHPKIVEAIKEQAEKLSSCHGYAYNEARAKLAEKLVEISPKGLDRVFLSNSGAEAVECALKLARKYTGKRETIAMVGGYHGKTMGALSATWNRKYRDSFQPLLPGFIHVPYGDVEKVEKAITEDTGSVIVEPIQGENGVRIPPENYLKELRELCDRKKVLLIFDEIQTGFGRTGKIFACEHWKVTPDILCLAKGLAGGLPIGVTMAKDEIMSSLSIGEHTSTYGGNPITAAAASAAIDVLLEERLPARALELGEHFLSELKDMERTFRIVREARGLGLMLALELRFDVHDIIMKAMDKGVLILDAGRTVLRFLPPLVITREQLNRVAAVLREIVEGKNLEVNFP
ncbi:MAG: aspartate aminotransferase family protein [Candidatus Bathyarchaeia archaeon]